jgi:hypothetical protein
LIGLPLCHLAGGRREKKQTNQRYGPGFDSSKKKIPRKIILSLSIKDVESFSKF